MSIIDTISNPGSWYIRESPSSSKMTAEISNKINALIANQLLVDDFLSTILQGAVGGTEQAKIPFGLPSAPTGWTRDTTFVVDSVLTIGTAGGSTGGTWTISGLSATSGGDHTHTLGSHTHSVDHTHAVSPHSHVMDHSHNMYHGHGGATATDAPAIGYSTDTSGALTIPTSPAGSGSSTQGYLLYSPAHTHTYSHYHGLSQNLTVPAISYSGSTSDASPATGSYSGTSSAPTVSDTGSGGSHGHSVSADGMWRPKYLNIMVCKKD